MYKSIYNIIANIYYWIIINRNILISKFVRKIHHKSIPIIINNRNRISFLKELIKSLEVRGYTNIIILDNDSSYSPLLEYYKNIPYKVIYLNKNIGYDALEKIDLYKVIRRNYFVYTDPDVVPIEECPNDFLDYFLKTLQKYPTIQKVGFSLKIDDLPDYFLDKYEVINHEKKFFQKELSSGLFLAPIDTTFALYRPYATLNVSGRFKYIRTNFPYMARHLPWYNNSLNLTEEEQFYISQVEIGTHWSRGLKVESLSFFDRQRRRYKDKKLSLNEKDNYIWDI